MTGDNLRPKNGAWRGTTWENAAQTHWHMDDFQEVFGVPLHIYRTFKGEWRGGSLLTAEEEAWVREGGILFYSTQPQDWAVAATDSYADQIRLYATAVSSVAPHKVMVAPGFEPDGHTCEVKTTGVFGCAKDYKAMYANYVKIFKEAGVDNAVFVMDYSMNIAFTFDEVAKALWPDNNAVKWLFFNVFQSGEVKSKKGDCHALADGIYNNFVKNSDHVNRWMDLPWGLGAYGTMNVTFSNPPKPISFEARYDCLDGIGGMFEEI